ncbi:DUF3907 family protein [Alteribacter aurantiacus]|uniref:DUF3907 family protein n=1 Tax=Alteribacter aurantiacus TaxID=254410 RepID=UPI00041E06AA|nr:DUF3907 family protein [Alteribacter aurantiacus]
MVDNVVRDHLLFTEERLSASAKELRQFLNRVTVEMLTDGDRAKSFVEVLLDDLRRLSVFFDEGAERCRMVLSAGTFRLPVAKKTLHWIFHWCVEAFFQPRQDAWYEESRAAYQNESVIRFRDNPPDQIQALFMKLEVNLLQLREEIEHYEVE